MSDEFNRPIGVFDSGVGGLTVLKDLALHFPKENFLYLGDTARLPYGTKSAETIRQYSLQNIQFLLSKKVKAIVIACNSASTQVPEREWQAVPVYNVIQPGAQAALRASSNKRIGLLGTRATVNSKAYERVLKTLDPAVEVFAQPCPLFVPLAEEGLQSDPMTNLIAYRYVSPLLSQGIDTLILGCTHYPLLKDSIAKAAGNAVQLVDSGLAITHELSQDISAGRLHARTDSGPRRLQIFCTDISEHFRALAHDIISPIVADEIEAIKI